jgi:Predicted GTPases
MANIKSFGKIPQLGEKIKVYYAVQIDTIPPQFKFFVNNADFFKKDVIRYFEKELQKHLISKDCRLSFILKEKETGKAWKIIRF